MLTRWFCWRCAPASPAAVRYEPLETITTTTAASFSMWCRRTAKWLPIVLCSFVMSALLLMFPPFAPLLFLIQYKLMAHFTPKTQLIQTAADNKQHQNTTTNEINQFNQLLVPVSVVDSEVTPELTRSPDSISHVSVSSPSSTTSQPATAVRLQSSNEVAEYVRFQSPNIQSKSMLNTDNKCQSGTQLSEILLTQQTGLEIKTNEPHTEHQKHSLSYPNASTNSNNPELNHHRKSSVLDTDSYTSEESFSPFTSSAFRATQWEQLPAQFSCNDLHSKHKPCSSNVVIDIPMHSTLMKTDSFTRQTSRDHTVSIESNERATQPQSVVITINQEQQQQQAQCFRRHSLNAVPHCVESKYNDLTEDLEASLPPDWLRAAVELITTPIQKHRRVNSATRLNSSHASSLFNSTMHSPLQTRTSSPTPLQLAEMRIRSSSMRPQIQRFTSQPLSNSQFNTSIPAFIRSGSDFTSQIPVQQTGSCNMLATRQACVAHDSKATGLNDVDAKQVKKLQASHRRASSEPIQTLLLLPDFQQLC